MRPAEIAAIVGSLVVFFVLDAQYVPDGNSWRIHNGSDGRASVQFNESRPGSRTSFGTDIPWSELHGLSPDALRGWSRPVKFELIREAGTFACEGKATAGSASGTFEFRPSREYAAELERLGFRSPTDDQLLAFANSDVKLSFVRAVHDAGLTDDTGKILELNVHGLTPEYLREVAAAGYRFHADDLIQLKIHGVSTALLRDLKEAKYSYTAEDIVQLQIHGVPGELLRDLKDAGYDVRSEEAVQMAIHGVRPATVRQLRDYGLRPAAEDLVQMQIQDVAPAYLNALKEAGYKDLTMDEIVKLKVQGVGTDLIRDARGLGYSFTPDELVQLKNNGVDGAYLRKLKDSGFEKLPAEKITQLKINGVD